MADKFISDLSGGMNTTFSRLKIKDNECPLIINYNLDKIGALSKRPGYDVFATQPVAGKTVLGLAQFTHTGTPAESTQVMVVNNSGDTQAVIYYNNSGTWATSKTNDTAVSTITNFNRSRFVTFLDYLFRVNGVDAVATSTNVNGSSWGTTNAPATVTPSFIAVYQDRVYIARTGASQGSRVYFSSVPSSDAITWDTTNDWFDVNPDDGDEITALENNGNRLLIFKNRALYRWTFGAVEPDRLIGVGTESQECVKTNLEFGLTFFANKRGAFTYDGGRVKLISRGIQSWFDAVPVASVNDFCAEVDNNHYYLYLGDSLTVNGRAFTNVWAVYNIPLDAWTMWSTNTPARVMNKLIVSNSEDIYFGNTQGRTYQLNKGTADDSSGASFNTATSINAEVEFKEHLLSFPQTTNISYIDVIADPHNRALVSYAIDGGSRFSPVGSLYNKFSFFDAQNKRDVGNSIQLKITDNSQATSRIEGYNIEHLPTKERP